MKKILLIVVALLFNSNIFAYDGRGNESCSDLRESINTIKEKIRDERNSIGYQVSENLCRAQNISLSSCPSLDIYKRQIEEMKRELADARDDYNMNGCTTGGKTNYNHNY